MKAMIPDDAKFYLSSLRALFLGILSLSLWVALCHFAPVLLGPIFVAGVLVVCFTVGFLSVGRTRGTWQPALVGFTRLVWSMVMAQSCASLAFSSAAVFDRYHVSLFAGHFLPVLGPALAGATAGLLGGTIGLARLSRRKTQQVH